MSCRSHSVHGICSIDSHCMHVLNNSLQKQQAAIQYKIAQYITNGRVCRVGQLMRLKLKLSANSAELAMSYEEVQ